MNVQLVFFSVPNRTPEDELYFPSTKSQLIVIRPWQSLFSSLLWFLPKYMDGGCRHNHKHAALQYGRQSATKNAE